MSDTSYSKITYAGTAPGADTNTYVLFATAPPSAGSTNFAFVGKRVAQGAGLHRLVIDMKHSQTGTMKFYRSQNRGTSWDQVYDSGVIAAPASNTSTIRDLYFEPYDDFKAEWVNGGSAQATWIVDISLTDERPALT